MAKKSKLTEAVYTAIDNQSKKIADKIFWEVRRECPKKSGRTARSFEVMKINGNYVVGSYKVTAYYAENGNGTGRIYPRRKKALKLTNGINRVLTDENGKPVIRASVSTYEGAHFLRDIASRHR